MESLVAKCFIAFSTLLILKTIFSVEGQSTVQGLDVADSSINIIDQMQELQNQLYIIITTLLAVKNQQANVMTSLRVADQRLLEQVQSNHELLNASYQQLENQQNKCLRSLQAVELRLQAQDLYMQRIHELLNASLHQTARYIDNQDISIKNETQISWTQANAFGIDDWIVIMNRFDGSVNFSRNWVDYRNGFGDKERGEFWLGNEQVHRLTNRFIYTLRIEVQVNSSGEWYYAEYSSFSLDSESNKYRLRLSGYSGNARDALTNRTFLASTEDLHGMYFSTCDNDNDRHSSYNCAQYYLGGWWFNTCLFYHYIRACLTCPYNTYFKWNAYSEWQTSGLLRAARMMIRSR